MGHKGLFFERLDAPVTGANPLPPLTPESVGFSFVRNRVLLHQHGRWAQGDPNATGAPLLTTTPFHGRAIAVLPPSIGIDRLFADGGNLHAYLRAAPLSASDPLGLWTLGEVLSSTSARRASQTYQAYEVGKGAQQLTQAIATGVGLQQALVMLAAEMVVDRFGGPAFEKVMAAAARGGMAVMRHTVAEHAWHHIIPVFLGGSKNGLVMLLKEADHVLLHSKLRVALTKAGINVSGKKGDTWWKLLEKNPEMKERALDVLRQVTQEFDRDMGTSIYPVLHRALQGGL